MIYKLNSVMSLVYVLLQSIFFDLHCRSDKSKTARLNQLTLTRQLSTFCSDDNVYARSRRHRRRPCHRRRAVRRLISRTDATRRDGTCPYSATFPLPRLYLSAIITGTRTVISDVAHSM